MPGLTKRLHTFLALAVDGFQHALAIKISMFTRIQRNFFSIAFACFSQSPCGCKKNSFLFSSSSPKCLKHERERERFPMQITRMFNFLSYQEPIYSFAASSRFLHVRLMFFTSIPRRKEHGSQPQRKPSVLVFSMTPHGIYIESFQWREQR